MTTQITPIPQTQIDELARFYTFTNRAEIIAFLEQYPDLVPLLIEAHGKIAKEFPDSVTHIEFRLDHEIPEFDHLNVTIVAPLHGERSTLARERFYMQAGGLEIADRARHRVLFDVWTPEDWAEE